MPKLPRLRAVRKAKMLSQDDLARRAGLSRPTISRVEAGEEARFVTVRKLAEALGVEPIELTGEGQGAS